MSDERRLPAQLTVYAAAELASRWRTWLAQDDRAGGPSAPLTLQAGQVEEVDGAGLQLLIALSNSLAERGRRLELQEPAPVLVRALGQLGAQALLDPAAVQEATR